MVHKNSFRRGFIDPVFHIALQNKLKGEEITGPAQPFDVTAVHRSQPA